MSKINKKPSNASETKFMEFSLGNENYAIPLLSVKEVIGIPKFTKIPSTPKYFSGIINLRDHILPVVDLRIKMGAQATEENQKGIIIIDLKPSIGVIVDSINRVLSLSDNDIEKAPQFKNNMGNNYIEGIQKSETKMTLIVNIAKILGDKDLKIAHSMKTAA